MSALDRAREILAVYDRGTHFNAKEVLAVLRELVDEISPPSVYRIAKPRAVRPEDYRAPVEAGKPELWRS